MKLKEKISFKGRRIVLQWSKSSVIPQNINISQVTGFCFTSNQKILIIKNKDGWGFPGGHPEPNERPQKTLCREIWEESAVIIGRPRLIGYLRVQDPQNQSIEGKQYVQLRYLCKIKEIKKFHKRFETTERKFVNLVELFQYIPWLNSAVGSQQYQVIKQGLGKK